MNNQELIVRFYNIRKKAREILKKKYLILLSGVLTAALLSMELFQFAFQIREDATIERVYLLFMQHPVLDYTAEQWLSMRMYISIGAGVLLLWRFLVLNVVNYGVVNSFRQVEKGEPARIFMGFGPQYGQIVKTKALADIFVAARYLLLIFPGIREAYSYYFLDYALYDNPDMPPMDLLTKVKASAEGKRLDYFKFDMNFFGWYIGGYYLNYYLFGLAAALIRPYILESRSLYYQDEKPLTDHSELKIAPDPEDWYR